MELGELILVYENVIENDSRSLIGSIIEINESEKYYRIRLDPWDILDDADYNGEEDDLTRIVPMDDDCWKKI